MASSGPKVDSSVLIAMICSAAVSAQFIAAKATRDALYLAHLDVTTLPVMVIATAVVSILLVVASSRACVPSPRHVRSSRLCAERGAAPGLLASAGVGPTPGSAACLPADLGLGPCSDRASGSSRPSDSIRTRHG